MGQTHGKGIAQGPVSVELPCDHGLQKHIGCASHRRVKGHKNPKENAKGLKMTPLMMQNTTQNCH